MAPYISQYIHVPFHCHDSVGYKEQQCPEVMGANPASVDSLIFFLGQ